MRPPESKHPKKLGLRFQDVTYDLPANATKLVVRVEARTTWWNEIVGFDNIRITSGEGRLLSAKRSGTSISIEFTGTLQSAASVTGPWTDVANAKSPFVIDKASQVGVKFYRAR